MDNAEEAAYYVIQGWVEESQVFSLASPMVSYHHYIHNSGWRYAYLDQGKN